MDCEIKLKMTIIHTMVFAAAACLFVQTCSADDYVKVEGKNFTIQGRPYYYIGCNYWYGSILGSTGEGGNRERLLKDLDLMQKLGINNLRILVGAEGPNDEPFRVTPALIQSPGKYDQALLDGLDFLMAEMGKRHMYAVLYLGNAWDWSGGFAQYLNWNGHGQIPYPMVVHSWTPFQQYVAQFQGCDSCKEEFKENIRFVLGRTNAYTGKKYSDDPTIMTWEIVNEPRPFGMDNIPVFEAWIKDTAAFIKSVDTNHLVTTGSEGKAGCEKSLEVYQAIHDDPNIDYLTMHIWPNNWRWIVTNDIPGTLERAITNTDEYMREHMAVARKLNKPLVMEEYGLPRDHHGYSLAEPTTCRDRYYENVFQIVLQNAKDNDVLAGCNFWAFAGEGRPVAGQTYWKKGDDYLGDPPVEEQGLNSVFDTDTTIKVIERYTHLVEDAAHTVANPEQKAITLNVQ